MPLPAMRLLAVREPDFHTVRFTAAFAAPTDDTSTRCASAALLTGDGETYDLGMLCEPTLTTWREAHNVALTTHRYNGNGPYVAELRWGDEIARQAISGPEPTRAFRHGPLLSLFALTPVADRQFERLVKFRVDGTTAGHQIRLDSGAGQVRFVPVTGDSCAAELLLSYAKPGAYTVTLDVVDEQGFWLALIAQSPLELAEPELPTEDAVRAAGEMLLTVPEQTAIPAEPWLPYRNFKPSRSGVRTYTRPGGGSVNRVVNPSVWLTARAETMTGGQRWFQTGGGDWVLGADVTFFQPTALRGIILGEAQPPPPPPPPPPPSTKSRGVITATTLNVRTRPGLGSGNPPVATLRAGAEVPLLEEVRMDGVTWYRIDEDRWIHGGYVRLLNPTEPPPPLPAGRRGIVTAATLNVRARPGVVVGNPPVAVLRAGATLTIYEEQRIAGEAWYRVAENRWIAAQWVRLVEEPVRSVGMALEAAHARLPFGWVIPEKAAIRPRPGTAADNLPVAELKQYNVIRVLDERQGSIRIGDDQWIDGKSVGVARFRSRPSSIQASQRWVGVCLSEQTLVAYEGDLPVFAALVSTGSGGTPTVQGIFRTWRRLATGKMSGPGYYIEDVTWTCYFHGGYALHTAYWHDKFGTVRSHGCVNMTPYDAWWVYQWSAPGGPNSPTVYVYWA
jgi:hypothetical protein